MQTNLCRHVLVVNPENYRRLLHNLNVSVRVEHLRHICDCTFHFEFHLYTPVFLSLNFSSFLVSLVFNSAEVELPTRTFIKHNLLLHLSDSTQGDFFVLKCTIMNILDSKFFWGFWTLWSLRRVFS